MPRRRSAATFAAAILVLAWFGTSVVSAANPPTIVVDVASGAPGQAITVTGSGYAAGTTYGVCILAADKTKCGFEGANIIGLEQFVAAADGTIPAGTAGAIPTLVAGSYHIVSTAPGTGFIVASTPFTVTAPSISLSPSSGAAGTTATVSVAGAAPNATYTICIIPNTETACGFVGIPLGDVKADAGGAFPAATTIRIPGQAAATYKVGLFVAGNNPTLITTTPFAETAPTLTLDTSSGPVGTSIGVSGSGFGAGAKYELCLVPAGAAQCGGVGIIIGGFQAGPDGSVPAGTSVLAPNTPPASYALGIRLQDSTPILLASSPFTVAAGTVAPATPASTPGLATAAPNSSAAPTGSDAGGTGGVPWLLIVIVLIIVLGLAFWFSRRRREAPPTPS